MLIMVKPRLNIVEKRWSKLLSSSFKLKWATHGAKCITKKKLASFGLFGTRPCVPLNLWKAKADGLINQGYLLCKNGEESIMHWFLECKYAQRVWDYMKTIVCELVNGVKPFQLAFPMQWKHATSTTRVPKHLHHVENIWSSFKCIILWSIWIEHNDLVFNNVRWDGFRIQKAIWDALLDYGRVA